MKKRAFTLAEVLLTLAIIGVVAALTIPAVITKVTQDQYVVGLRKAYNTLKSVEREAIQENGPIEDWDWTKDVKDSFETYFKSHFDILKDCGYSTDEGCFHSAKETKYLNGVEHLANYNNELYYKIITSDGIAYSYASYASSYPSRVASFTVDVNGKKGPNTIGRDIFAFHVFRKTGIKPDGSLLASDETETVPSSDVSGPSQGSCNISAQGWYCATKVLSEGAMNY